MYRFRPFIKQEPILPNVHFSGFPIFAVKLECLQVRGKYVFMRNGQAYQQITEKFSISEEKKFGKIDFWLSYE